MIGNEETRNGQFGVGLSRGDPGRHRLALASRPQCRRNPTGGKPTPTLSSSNWTNCFQTLRTPKPASAASSSPAPGITWAYQEALVRVDQKLASLRSLTRDNPSQQKRLAAAEPLIRAKLAALKETINLRATKGFDPAREIIMTGRGKALMDQVRQQVAEAQAEEGRLLKERSLAKEADLRSRSQVVIIGSVFSCVFLVTALLLLQGEIARRLGVEQELLKHRDHLEELVASRTKELGRLNRTLKALSNSNQALIRSKDESQFLGEVCRIIVRDCGHALVWIGYAEGDEAKTVRPVAHAGFEEGYLETLNITWADTERGRGPTGTAIRTGKPCHCKDMQTDPRFGPWREQALKLGYGSSLVLPLMTGGRAFGAITIYSRQAAPSPRTRWNC